MKTVIIQTGSEAQIDLIPENDFEKSLLSNLKEGTTMRVGKASGYDVCVGDYYRPYGEPSARSFTFVTTVGETKS